MSIEDLQGRSYERTFRADRSNVAAFIDATGDDPHRWEGTAPPSFAGAALFAVAPAFLYDPDVGNFSRVLIHADQTFRWRAPWELDSDYIVTGSVDRVRMRGGSAWVTFGAVVTFDDDTTLESLSTFIMSDRRTDSGSDDRNEPAPMEKAAELRPEFSQKDGALPATVRSASRSDLIRYAAASRDFNPLHWDHDTARNAGLPGVVVHGLLMVSWMLQTAAELAPLNDRQPIREAKFRFRNPLLPGQPAAITGGVDLDRTVSLELSSDSGPLVTGSVTIGR
ncbi:MAG TPA: MaoC family dehydratase [Acidimicrobiia bacterium]|nr:MaoC family dehydratase [Acidimicrobiia bacterium]